MFWLARCIDRVPAVLSEKPQICPVHSICAQEGLERKSFYSKNDYVEKYKETLETYVFDVKIFLRLKQHLTKNVDYQSEFG